MKKRLLSILLCLVMVVTLLPTAALAAGRFTDVTTKDWFYNDVEYAVEQGLVNGVNATTYAPNSNLTYAAAVKLAACMHKKVTKGNTDFTVGSPWYQVYVDYAKDNGILPANKTYNWNANATRADYMEIFANAIPDRGLRSGYSPLTTLNTVEDGAIPDVPTNHPQADAIYKLYRAGILQGDKNHNCTPDSFIRRSEVAAILTRMMDSDARIKFELKNTTEDPVTPTEPVTPVEPVTPTTLTITQQPKNVTGDVGDWATYTVTVSGGKTPYTYQWQSRSDDASDKWGNVVNGTTLKGAATAKLETKILTEDFAYGYQYRCVITDADGKTVTSNAAAAVKATAAPTITQQPKNVTCQNGDQVNFTVAVSGGKTPYTYQWQWKVEKGTSWSNLGNNDENTGTKTKTLSVRVNDQDISLGSQYRCVITDANGSTVYSDAAAVKAADAPTITQQPNYVTCQVGDVAKFTVAATGGKTPYTYQWQWKVEKGANWSNLTDDSSITGAKKSTLSVKVTDQDLSLGSQYRCVITDANGSAVYSNAGKVQLPRPTVSKALTITQHPQNISVGDHTSTFVASIQVAVTGGKAPYTYEWQEQHRTDSDDPNSVTAWSAVQSETVSGWGNSAWGDLVLGYETNENVLSIHQADAFSHRLTYKCYMYRCKITDAAGTTVYSNPMRFIEFSCDFSYVIVTSLDGTTTRYFPPARDITVKGGDTVTIKANVTNAAGPFVYSLYPSNVSIDGSFTGDTLTITIPKENLEKVTGVSWSAEGAKGANGVSMFGEAVSEYIYLHPAR